MCDWVASCPGIYIFISWICRILILPAFRGILRRLGNFLRNLSCCGRALICYDRVNQAYVDEENLRTENQRLRQEKDDALFRLSELMSLKLRDGNPNVVDLSDEYRPTKLVEISSELYDNEWTEAYEFLLKVKPGLGDGADRQHVRFLLDVLLETYEFCKTVCKKEWESVVSSIWGGNVVNNTEEQKMVKDLRKKNAKERFPDIQKQCLEHLKSCFQSHSSDFKDGPIFAYVKGCLRVCWFMQFQDPPVIFICPNWKSSHISSKASLISYSQNLNLQPLIDLGEEEKGEIRNAAINAGNNEFLPENCDMPAEIQYDRETALTSEKSTGSFYPQETQDDKIDEDRKVTEGIKAKKIEFDTSLFKEYTKKGKYVDFIVWPIMYLHRNGPILSRGVAQGYN